jgi:hypothetical protein
MYRMLTYKFEHNNFSLATLNIIELQAKIFDKNIMLTTREKIIS